jgi:hypothetical protein
MWCPGAESNHRHCDFQSHALPTELPGHPGHHEAGSQPIAHAIRPIKHAHPAQEARLRQGHPGQRGRCTARSTNGPDRHRRSGGYRTAGHCTRLACRRSDRMALMVQLQASVVSIIHSVVRRCGSDRRIKGRPARRARSAKASVSPCSAATIAGEARNAGRRCRATATCTAI